MADDEPDNIAASVDDLAGALAKPVRPKDLPAYSIYTPSPLTGVSPKRRQKLHLLMNVVDRILKSDPHPKYDLSLYLPGTMTDPIVRNDLFPSEVYAKNLERIATSPVNFAFLNPRCHGVGQEIEISRGCGTPV